MVLQIQKKTNRPGKEIKQSTHFNESIFSKDYVDFLSEAGWKLEKKLPSNKNHF